MKGLQILEGDSRETLKGLPAASVDCCVTSPPYWALRDYLNEKQIGMEKTPEEYIDHLLEVFAQVYRVLKPTGTLWLNLGDSYAASGKGGGGLASKRKCWKNTMGKNGYRMPPPGYKMKDLTLLPAQVAIELRKAGWYLRSQIIWRKPTAVEPTRLDRPSTSHEHIFLLSRNKDYHCVAPNEHWWFSTVWEIRSDDTVAHTATMPAELARRCIKAGCPSGGIVLDPFAGSGTTAAVALAMDRAAILCELDPDCIAQIHQRCESFRPHWSDNTDLPGFQ